MARRVLSARRGDRWWACQDNTGTTLIESLAALAMTALLAAAGYPSYRDALERQQVRVAADLLAASIETARAFALARRGTVLLAPRAGIADFSRGWRIVAAEANDADETGEAPTLSVVTLGAACLRVALRATDGSPALRLAPVGYSRSERGGFYAATFTLRCGDAQRQVRLGALGRLRICTPGQDADCDSRTDARP
ncbi:GspH/FimT family pseudopilin [Cupriavidus sp. HPC(L)]|uniref:GspH/FimT family protein n=1 Tax=Cupriavidus sp. HPC(L) TaxID=1217418 RepID=UPI0002D5F132|nr:GspH/FimT family pseudopilin [Cupriavidus sp. HPC(L)]